MRDELENLRDAVIERARQTGDIETIEKAISISKLVAEEKKTQSEIKNVGSTYRLSRLQSVMSGATTILSVLGLIIAGLYNVRQLSETRSQAEVTEWRDLLSSIAKSPDNLVQDPTIPLRLRSFASSHRYAEDARLLAATVMSKMADAEGFELLFRTIFPLGTIIDLNTMLEIDRQQTFSKHKLQEHCTDASKNYKFPPRMWENICWAAYNDTQLKEFGLNAGDENIWILRKRYNAVLNQIDSISSKISDYLKINNSKDGDSIPFNNLEISATDFSEIDFSRMDISGTFFDQVALDGAVLNPRKYDNVKFAGSTWWRARTIKTDLLQYLAENMYPRRGQYYRQDDERPTRTEYERAIRALGFTEKTLSFEGE
jgi:hypothetical protein